jgi:hypothetical protein
VFDVYLFASFPFLPSNLLPSDRQQKLFLKLGGQDTGVLEKSGISRMV